MHIHIHIHIHTHTYTNALLISDTSETVVEPGWEPISCSSWMEENTGGRKHRTNNTGNKE